jgi:ABC-type Zn uptake system ZnuABC Zn-binding protein ZnuA
MAQRILRIWMTLVVFGAGALILAACGSTANQPATDTVVETVAVDPAEDSHEMEAEEQEGEAEILMLPDLSAVTLDGRPLRVVATTSIIGDVVGRVGGSAIELTTLIGPGQDPHSYQPAAAELTAAANADVIFINGWDLEEGLVADLATIAPGAAIVPVSAGIVPLPFGGHSDEHEDEHEDASEGAMGDPHVWLAVDNVIRWTGTIVEVLSTLDSANAGIFLGNGLAYQTELGALDAAVREQLAAVPAERRVLVTNHDAFGYFADAYGFDILGTIIPGASTLAEPTASDLAALVSTMQAQGVCALFSESTVSDRMSQTVAAELDDCDTVQIVSLFSGALGAPGSGADTYLSMMQANVDAIVAGLR